MTNLRADVEKALGWRMSDAMWEDLAGDGEAMSQRTDRAAVRRELVTAIKQRMAIYGHTPATRADGPTPSMRPTTVSASARIDALSAIYAAWANSDSKVEWFRRSYLVPQDTPEYEAWIAGRGDYPDFQLLPPEDVNQWIMDHFNADSSDSNGTRHIEALLTARRPSENPVVDLWYIANHRELALTVDSRWTLGDLAKISMDIAGTYQWRQSEAATFVLTGRQPEVFVYTGSASILHGATAACSRVTMTLDPFLTPDQVADIYSRLKARLHSGPIKSLSEKHYRLAQHIGPHVASRVDHPRRTGRTGRPLQAGPTGLAHFIEPADGATWQSLRRDWNNLYGHRTGRGGKAWHYDYQNHANFIRDAKKAFERLLFPPWKRPDESE
ncbi:hypothetical protein P3T27_001509 [Kitasatospora sp. MAA19]|uniref:hypothetical protein n=1 Tax=Kitasatospora sp. MAA19 TaxID=3035090 RepID=UPI002474914E|nr:hypothetical protein [Kitasatospora sp. MAA19]MDH6704806.1 hypothetical protein [Kitasatospora sp. MAA19]